MFLRDFRFAIRTLLHQPGFTAVVLITLGLGIGAFDVGNRQITGGDIPQNLRTAFWWGDPLTVLGMSPKHGRFFSPREIREMAPLALVSNRVFEARFAGDPDMIGQTIQINGVDHTLIGVFPSAATVYGIDLWTPMWAQPEDFSRTRRVMNLIARLGDGVTLAQANAELEAVARRTELEYAGQHDEYLGWRLETMTWTDANVRTLKPSAFVLMGTVSFVLLLVCCQRGQLAAFAFGQPTTRDGSTGGAGCRACTHRASVAIRESADGGSRRCRWAGPRLGRLAVAGGQHARLRHRWTFVRTPPVRRLARGHNLSPSATPQRWQADSGCQRASSAPPMISVERRHQRARLPPETRRRADRSERSRIDC